MKKIKKLYSAVIILLLFIATQTIYAQFNITGTYTGTWQYDNNNERFIVKIWQEGTNYYGHYKKVQLNNGIAGNTIYNSLMTISSGDTYPFSAIYVGYTQEYGLSGFIYDNVASGTVYNPRSGALQMKIITMVPSNGCNGCVVKASWKVTSTGGLMVGDPPPFSMPLDIELTKVSNTITLD